MTHIPVSQISTPKNSSKVVAEAAYAVLDVRLALRQRAKELNLENHLRSLQLALHADSEKVWNMTLWYW